MYFDTGFACHHAALKLLRRLCAGRITFRIRFEAYSVYTNKMGCGSFRGPGGIQAHFAGESQIDIICRELGLDPIAFRRRNGVQEVGPQALACACAGLACARRWIVRLTLCIGTSRSPVSRAKRSGVVWPAASGAWGAGVARGLGEAE